MAGARSLELDLNARTLQELLAGLVWESRERDAVMARMWDLRWNRHAARLNLPKELPHQAYVFSSIAAQQIDMQRGIFAANTPVTKATTVGVKQSSKTDAEHLELWLERTKVTMETQAGAVFEPKLEDTFLLGHGVETVMLDRSRLADLPSLDGHDGTSDQYLEKRQEAIRQTAYPRGKFPLRHQHVSAKDFYWRENPESGSELSLTAERRQRRVYEILSDDRYKDNVEGLWKYYDKERSKRGGDKRAAAFLNARCNFFVVCTKDAISYLTLPAEVPLEAAGEGNDGWTAESITVQENFLRAYSQADLAYQIPNAIGRPPYVITPGLTSTSREPAYRTRSMLFDMESLLIAWDRFLTIKLRRSQQFAFAPLVLTRPHAPPNQQMGVGPGGQIVTFDLKAGPYSVNVLPDGYTFSFVVNPASGDQHEMEFLHTVREHIDLLGIPRSVLSGDGVDAGYLYASLVQTTEARSKPIANHVATADTQFGYLVMDLALASGETLEVAGNPSTDASSTWVALEPKVIQDNAWNLSSQYELRKKVNTLADFQAVQQAITLRTHTMEEAMEEFLGKTNHEQVSLEWDVFDLLQDPSVKGKRLLEVAKEAGLTLEQEDAQKDQQAIDILKMAKMSPVLAEVLTRMAQPGTHLYAVAQAYQQGLQSQNGQQPAQPPPGPQIPPNGAGAPGVNPGAPQGQPQPVGAGPGPTQPNSGAPVRPGGAVNRRGRPNPRAGQATAAVPGVRRPGGGFG